MAQFTSSLGGLNLYTNPLMDSQSDGQIIRAVNVDSSPYQAKNKRSGYVSFLGTPDTSSITTLFDWVPDAAGTMNLYRASGSLLYYSVNGTGAWSICGNGTITPGSHVGQAVLNNTLIISQSGGTTRHSTNGTSFTDTSLAPAGEFIDQYQNRIYITGTSSQMTFSVTNDPTNWQTSGTSDSSSLTIPGRGLPNKLFKLNNRLMISKASRNMFKWDGYNLIDMSSNMGLSSPYSYGSVEANGFWLNEKGIFTSAGDQPELISNPIYRFFQNNLGSQIAGTSFGSAPATVHYYDYLCAVGSMTDDFTNETVPNAIIKYNFQKNEFTNWSFADFPTAMRSYRDLNSNTQLIFGNASGQVMQYQGTATSDNGQPIESILELMFDFGNPLLQKEWRILWGFFNPGCGATIEVATSETYIKENKKWQTVGPAKEGVVYYRFRNGERARFLYVKITDNSRDPSYTCYGIGIDAVIVPAQ
jgi:hypothetical protein